MCFGYLASVSHPTLQLYTRELAASPAAGEVLQLISVSGLRLETRVNAERQDGKTADEANP